MTRHPSPVRIGDDEMDINDLGRVAGGEQALVSDQAATHLGPSGFDPSRMSHDEQMRDAEAKCVPCKLCGGKAVISDAGPGSGYYIRCSRSLTFRESKGCLLDERRLGGWAYNVMEWRNRLHASAIEAGTGETEGLDAKRESAVPEADAQSPSQNLSEGSI